MGSSQFYYCTVCGNIIEKVHDSGNDLECCARTMMKLEAGTTDGKVEWHVPVCNVNGKEVDVNVGLNPHPMEKDHYIEWIEITTNKGVMRKYLNPGEEPSAHFTLCDGEEICSIFAYCNKHKLWKAKC